MEDFDPSMVPEKFHHTGEDGEFDVAASMNALVTSYNEFGGRIRQTEEEVATRVREEVLGEIGQPPSAAGEYKLMEALPEDLSMNGASLEELNGDPMIEVLRETALAMGVPEGKFGAGQEAFFRAAARMQEAAEQELGEVLGSNYEERLGALKTSLANRLGEEEAAPLLDSLTSAKAVRALEKLTNAKPAAPDAGGNGGDEAPPMTIEELRALQSDPKYWRDNDPVITKRVIDGYEALSKYQKGRRAA